MKTIQVDGQDMVVVHVRGNGDGGMNVAYLVDMGDGTFADEIVWWSDPVAAKDTYDNASAEYLMWAKDSALRRLRRKTTRLPAIQPHPVSSTKVNNFNDLSVFNQEKKVSVFNDIVIASNGFQLALKYLYKTERMAGAEGLEPPAYGFGDRRSTS